jgi:hypothetical protein
MRKLMLALAFCLVATGTPAAPGDPATPTPAPTRSQKVQRQDRKAIREALKELRLAIVGVRQRMRKVELRLTAPRNEYERRLLESELAGLRTGYRLLVRRERLLSARLSPRGPAPAVLQRRSR